VIRLLAAIRKTSSLLAFAAGLSATCSPAASATFQAQLQHQGGILWSADVSSTNSGASTFESITLYLDFAHTRNLAVLASPAPWDTLVVQADLELASDAFVDLLLIDTPGIESTVSLTGLTIGFEWLGGSIPIALRYTINDPDTFAVLEAGHAAMQVTANVPEPASWLLFALPLSGLAVVRTTRLALHNLR